MHLVSPSLLRLELFALATIPFLLLPGPTVFYLVTRSVELGWRGGVLSVLGIHAASCVHIVAAAAGISTILESSATAFAMVKWIGAAYLIWLGLRKLAAPPAVLTPRPSRLDAAKLLREAFLVNLLNPKTAIFLLAFLPQFVDVERGGAAAQIIVLGLLYVAFGFLCDSFYVFSAGAASSLLRRNRRFLAFERVFGGSMMIGLGLAAGLLGVGKKS